MSSASTPVTASLNPTAQQIREQYHDTGLCETQDAQVVTNLLAEIAAQLAQLNSNLRAAFPAANLPDECREQKCSYYLHYLAYGPADLTHEGFHAAESNGIKHMADCSRARNGNTCGVCEGYERRLRA